MTQELAPIEPQAISLYEDPEDVIKRTTAWANSLIKVVQDKGMSSYIGRKPGEQKEYLNVEGWQLIGSFAGVHAVTDYVREYVVEGEVVGHEAKVLLMQGDQIISSGIMTCGYEEFPCQGKKGMAKVKAAVSAAQTWAESKAYRMKFAFVAKLAGYEPTPSEEMHETPGLSSAPSPRQSAPAPTPTSNGTVQVEDTGDHRCPYHNTEWAQTERMRGMNMGHSHSLGKDMGWCNQKDVALSMNKELSDIGKTIVETIGVTEEEARETVRRYLEENFKKSWPDLTFAEAKQALDDLSEVHAGSYPADNDPSSPKNIERSLL